MSWTFTADEFAHVWQAETGDDRYPFPLTVYSAADTEDRYAALAQAAAQRWPTGADPDLTAVLRHAARPDTALAVFDDAGPRLRAYGARSGERGVVIRQYDDNSVEVFSGSAGMVARAFASFLGELQAGQAGHLVEDIDRLAAHFESWQRPPDSVAARMHRLTETRRTASGHIEARVGLHTERPTPARYLTWLDVADDGRYLTYRRYQDLHIEPAGKQRLIDAIEAIATSGAHRD
ncbi:ESX secretion-associated protein EspG [Nocardia sp. NPDC058497]|uniref:ESX secretion-associated protein EspG n=1 Tax=Nocardia sp. NPDC058497 TaxID=3346529 RepID=UPI0036698676